MLSVRARGQPTLAHGQFLQMRQAVASVDKQLKTLLVLAPRESFTVDELGTEFVNPVLEAAAAAQHRSEVTRYEYLLCLALQKPDSSKFGERLLKYTAELTEKTQRRWEEVLHGDVAYLVHEGLESERKRSAREAAGGPATKVARTSSRPG